MAIEKEQVDGIATAGGGITSIAFDNNTTTGNAIMVWVYEYGSFPNAGEVTDGKSNSYTLDKLGDSGSAWFAAIYSSLNIAGSSNAAERTVQFDTSATYSAIAIAEFNGVATSSAAECANDTAGSASTSHRIATNGNTTAADLLFGAFHMNGIAVTITESGCTKVFKDEQLGYGPFIVLYKIQTEAGSGTLDCTTDPSRTFENEMIVAYKPAAGGATYDVTVKKARLKIQARRIKNPWAIFTVPSKRAGIKAQSRKPLSSLTYTEKAKIIGSKVGVTISKSSLRIIATAKRIGVKMGSQISRTSLTALLNIKKAGIKIGVTVPGPLLSITQAVKRVGVKIGTAIPTISTIVSILMAIKTVGVKVGAAVPQIRNEFFLLPKRIGAKIGARIPVSEIVTAILIAVKTAGVKIGVTVPLILTKMSVLPKYIGLKIQSTISTLTSLEAILLAIKYVGLKVGTTVAASSLRFTLSAKRVGIKVGAVISKSLLTLPVTIRNAGVKARATTSRLAMTVLALPKRVGVKIRTTLSIPQYKFMVGVKIARLRARVTISTSGIATGAWLAVKKFVTKAVFYRFKSGANAARYESKAEDYRFVAKND